MTSSAVLPVLAARISFSVLLDPQEVLHVDLHIRDLALRARGGLVDHNLGVGQRDPLALGAGGQQESSHGLAAMPTQMVDTSHLTYCMVS